LEKNNVKLLQEYKIPVLQLTANGLKPAHRAELKEGQILFMNGYGHGRGEQYAIFNIEQNSFAINYHVVNILKPAATHIVNFPKPDTEVFGIGWYYYTPPQFATKEQIYKGLMMAEQFRQEAEQKEREAKREREALTERLIKEYPYLERVDGYNGLKVAAKNIRKELKKHFPGVKFSVRLERYSMGNNITVAWLNGPEQNKVEKIICKYQIGHFDGMQDLYEYNNNPFNKIFGGTKYLHTNKRS